MEKPGLTYALLGVVLLVVSTCGPKITSKTMSGKNVHEYATYAWLPNNDSVESSKFNDRIVQREIIGEVNKCMMKEGYNLDRTNPDLLILAHTMFDEERDVTREPIYASYSYYTPQFYVGSYYNNFYYYNYTTVPRIVGYDVETVAYTEGTVVIDLIDAKTHKLVWRGTAEGVIDPTNVETEVKRYVNDIFDDFPKPVAER